MSFYSDILKGIARGLDPRAALDDNPLSIVGIGPEILNLGLPDEALYQHCLRVAVDLVARFHPDKGLLPDYLVDSQKRFSAAFNQLKDRPKFNVALAEFRQNHSEKRSEENRLKRIIRELKDSSEMTLVKNRDLEGENQRFSNEQKALRDKVLAHINMSSKRFSKSQNLREFLPIRQAKKMVLVRFRFQIGTKPDEEKLSELAAEYRKMLRQDSIRSMRNDWEGLKGKFRSFGGLSQNVKTLFDEAFDSEDLFPQILWWERTAFSKRELTRRIKVGGDHPTDDWLLRRARKPSAKLFRHYRKALAEIRDLILDRTEWVSECVIGVEVVPANLGFLTEGRKQLCIMGSVMPTSLSEEMMYRSAQQLIYLDHTLFQVTHPLVIQDGFLVTTAPDRLKGVTYKFRGNLGEDKFLDAYSEIKHFWSINHYILNVE